MSGLGGVKSVHSLKGIPKSQKFLPAELDEEDEDEDEDEEDMELLSQVLELPQKSSMAPMSKSMPSAVAHATRAAQRR